MATVEPKDPTDEIADDTAADLVTPGPPLLPRGQILLLIAATFGGGMALVVPLAYSLTVRLDQLAPGRADLLGLVLGVGAAATLVLAPLTGVLSDRTRSRWGRRRPFTVIGLVVGAASVPVMTFAPDLLWLTVGWVMSTAGWGTAAGSVGNWQADRLPVSQRGSVSGLTGLTMQIAPVIGIIAVGPLRESILLVFAIPAVVAVILIGIFVGFVPDPDSRGMSLATKLTLGDLLRSYLFRPRAVPDFAWNWLGRFVFFLGLSLTTSFTVFFIAQRLTIPVADVAEVQALVSALSIGTALVGSVGGGWLSDRIRRRKPIILIGALLFAAGSVVSAFAHDLASIIAGVLVTSVGIASFAAVGQAVVLDVLPERETQAGRYMAITMFSQKIPSALSPIAAPLLLTVGGGAQNFTLLYLAAAVLAVVGGVIIVAKVHGVR